MEHRVNIYMQCSWKAKTSTEISSHLSTVSNSAGKQLGSRFKDYISYHMKQSAIQPKFAYKCPQFSLFWIYNRNRPKNVITSNALRQYLRDLETFLFSCYIFVYVFLFFNSKVIKQRRHGRKPLKMRGSGYSRTLIWLRDVVTRSLWYQGKSLNIFSQ